MIHTAQKAPNSQREIKFLKNKGLIALASTFLLPALMHASAIYITTTNTGAQTQMDVNHDSVFSATSLSLACSLTTCATADTTYFDPTFDWDLAGGDFAMKVGSGTTANVTFSFYDTVDGLLASVDYKESDFCSAHGGNCQSFAQTMFTFTSGPITLLTGHHYYGTITSGADDTQSTAYFIKGLSQAGFTPNAPIDPNPPTNDPPPSNDPPTNVPNTVPEPGSVWMMIGGAVSVVVFRRRK